MHGVTKAMLLGCSLCCATLPVFWSVAADNRGEEYAVKDTIEAVSSKRVALEKQEAATQKNIEMEKVFADPTTGMQFVLVPGGCFQMGNTVAGGDALGAILPSKLFWYFNMGGAGGKVDIDEKPAHEVCVDSFYLGKYEVTQKEYRAIIGSNPSTFQEEDSPVEQVNWNDAQVFIAQLVARSGRNYRLPTEGEWEYAARSGGRPEKYAGGNDIEAVAWYDQKFERPHTVGEKLPNGLGLYDMSGNVWEWCQDWYDKDYYSKSPKLNPAGPDSGSERVVRGGSFDNYPRLARTANRLKVPPDTRKYSIGFRMALPIKEVKVD